MNGKKVAFVLGILSLLCLPGFSHATIIQYDAVNLVDNLGNPASGKVRIDANVQNLGVGEMEFSIVDFNFASAGGSNSGTGFIRLYGGQTPGTINPGDSISVFNGDITWSYNFGVWFCDDSSNALDPTDQNYSILQPYILICADTADIPSWSVYTSDHVGNYIVLKEEVAQPVPEPASLLLVGAGLIGIAGFRKKLKK